jgi:hypothetical protein
MYCNVYNDNVLPNIFMDLYLYKIQTIGYVHTDVILSCRITIVAMKKQ